MIGGTIGIEEQQKGMISGLSGMTLPRSQPAKGVFEPIELIKIFDYQSIATCGAAWEANFATLDGSGNYEALLDLSGNGIDLSQSDPALRPPKQNDGILFTEGAGYILSALTDFAQNYNPMICYYVADFPNPITTSSPAGSYWQATGTSATSLASMLHGTGTSAINNERLFLVNRGPNPSSFGVAGITSTDIPAGTKLYQVQFGPNLGDSAISINLIPYVLSTGGNTGNGSPGGGTAFHPMIDFTLSFRDDIILREFAVFSGLTAQEQTDLEDYFTSKYQLT